MRSNSLHAFYVLVGQGGLRPPLQIDGKMHVGCWIQQVTTRVGAVTCWIQPPVSPKQVVGFSCLFNSELTNWPFLFCIRIENFEGACTGQTFSKFQTAEKR